MTAAMTPMSPKRMVTLSALVGGAIGFPTIPNTLKNESSTLSWGACDGIASPFECAHLQVPLDWADEQKGNITLAVVRLPATTQPSEGYMFYNPGVPGIPGLGFLAGMGAQLQSQLGQSWDVLSWDPRGVGKSGPDVTLFSTATESNHFWGQTLGVGNVDSHGNLTTLSDFYDFMNQATIFDDILKSFNDQYVARVGDNLKYIGSCAVVRDLVAMTEAIYGPGADINFYGISYGTVLGVYLTQMFPDRVGKVILDGVVDAYTYANVQPMDRMYLDVENAEAALKEWIAYCVAAPDNCSLASLGNGTVTGVISVINDILDTAYPTYDGSSPPNATGYTFDQIAKEIYLSLSNTGMWKNLDNYLVSLHALQTSSTAAPSAPAPNRKRMRMLLDKLPRIWHPIIDARQEQTQSETPFFSPEIRYAINCGDVVDPADYNTIQLFRMVIDVASFTSPHFGSLLSYRWICHRYTTRSVERFSTFATEIRDMKTRPKNAVLVIGNSDDPMAPYASAKNIASSARLGGAARLIRLKAVGHTSISSNSTCLNSVIHSFIRGDVPKDAGNDGPDVECDINGNPFNTL